MPLHIFYFYLQLHLNIVYLSSALSANFPQIPYENFSPKAPYHTFHRDPLPLTVVVFLFRLFLPLFHSSTYTLDSFHSLIPPQGTHNIFSLFLRFIWLPKSITGITIFISHLTPSTIHQFSLFSEVCARLFMVPPYLNCGSHQHFL